MIEKIEAYSVECDACGEIYEDTNGHSIFADETSMKEYMNEDDWHIGDGIEDAEGVIKCPKCFHYDEEDKFHSKPKKEAK